MRERLDKGGLLYNRGLFSFKVCGVCWESERERVRAARSRSHSFFADLANASIQPGRVALWLAKAGCGGAASRSACSARSSQEEN